MNPPYILALDIGTSSVRAALYDSRGQMLPETLVKNDRRPTLTAGGGAEIDAGEAINQIFGAIDEVLTKNDSIVETVSFAAASCFWHSLVGIDSAGRATTPVYTWAETRPANYIRVLRRELNEAEAHHRTGAPFHSSYWTAKLLWLREEFPDVFQKTAKWLSLSDLFALRLFGRAVTSVSMASGTGIFDFRRNDWDEPLLDYLKIGRENLPRIARDNETFQIARSVAHNEHSNAFNAPPIEKLSKIKWFPAIGDGAANNIGAGCVNRSKAALMVGTSGAMRVACEGEPPARIPFGLWCYRIDRGRFITGGALSDGGGLYRWLRDNLRLDADDDRTEAEIARRAPDAHGLVFLPFLAGERSTGYNESARGAVFGLTTATDAVDITQAALEAVAYRFAEIFERLNEFLEIKEIIASGGALRESPVWTQIMADVLGRDLSLPDTREASLRGAVLLALETIGKIERIADLQAPPGRAFRSDRIRHKIYLDARARHNAFYRLLTDFEVTKI